MNEESRAATFAAHRRADALLDELLDLPADERAAHLAAVAAGEPEAARLAGLLLEAAAVSSAGPTAAAGMLLPPRDRGSELMAGDRVGVWRIVSPLGRGGMSRVYVAERAGGFSQRAALKLMAVPPERSSEFAQRFERERQILAALEHPNFAKVLDGGVTPDERPFVVLELVEGLSIDRHAEAHGLDVEARVRLVIDVARAIQHAHRNLIVHRDIKPSNILVTEAGVVKVLDFGIAKVLEGAKVLDLEGMGDAITRTLSRPLTPVYASPEQVRGGAITTASDIYQLGLLLYELIAGVPAHLFREDSWRELERVVCETEVPRLTTLDRTRFPRALAGEAIPYDLETITAKALAKEPERRYLSAEQLAEDLERMLQHQPVLARPDTIVYRAGRFVRRHRLGVAFSLLVVLLLAGGATALAIQARRIARERDRARTVARFVVDVFESNDPQITRGKTPDARELLDRGVSRVESELAGDPEMLATMLLHLSDMNQRIARPEVAESLARKVLALAPRTENRDEHTAEANRLLGGALKDQGHYADALAAFSAARAGFEAFAPPTDHRIALTVLGEGNNLAYLLRLDEASAHIADAVARFRVEPVDPFWLSEALADLGLVEIDQGRHEEAEAHARESLAVIVADLGESDERTVWARNNLAFVLERRGKLETARDLYRTSLEMRRRMLAPDHPAIGTALHNLARVSLSLGDVDEAERLGREALAIREQALGPEHPDTLLTRFNLGLVERERRHPDEALAILAVACPGQRKALGENHRAYHLCEIHQGLALLDSGEAAQAAELRPHGEKVLALAGARDGVIAALFLARLDAAAGDARAALAGFERAVATADKLGNPRSRPRFEAAFLATCLRWELDGDPAARAEARHLGEQAKGDSPRVRALVEARLADLARTAGGAATPAQR